MVVLSTSNLSAKGGLDDPAARGIFFTVLTAWAKTRSRKFSSYCLYPKVEIVPTESAIHDIGGTKKWLWCDLRLARKLIVGRYDTNVGLILTALHQLQETKEESRG